MLKFKAPDNESKAPRSKTKETIPTVYVLFNTEYPEYFRVGYTGNPESNLENFNRFKPINTAYYVKTWDAKIGTRNAVVAELQKQENLPELNTGWFHVEFMDDTVAYIQDLVDFNNSQQ